MMKCSLFSVVEDMRDVMEDGIPELGLPSLDPLFIDEITFDFNAATIKVGTERDFQNNVLTNLFVTSFLT